MNNLKYTNIIIKPKDRVRDIILTGICLLIFNDINEFIIRCQYTGNIYDAILYFFNNFFSSIFVLPIAILLILYKINTDYNKYVYLRCSNRLKWINLNIKSIAKVIFAFVVLIILCIVIFCYILGLGLYPKWSSFALISYTSILNYNPLLVVIVQILLFYMYLFTLSLLLLTFNIIFKNNIKSLIIVVIINFLNVGIILSDIESIGKFSLGYNMLLDLHNLGINSNYPTIKFSIVYWISIIVLLYLCLKKYIKKVDLI